MKRSLNRALVAAALLSASGAFAVKVGDELYIKAKDTKVLKDAKATASAVVTLQPGTKVKWLGPNDKDKQFHQVEANGKKGFVLMSNLSPNAPQQEIDASSGKPMSAQAFASSGAATKALTPAGVKYAKESGVKATEAAAQIIYVEEFNKAKGTPTAIAAKAKALETGK